MTTPNSRASPSASAGFPPVAAPRISTAARGDRDGALKAFSDGLEIAKRLAARDPNNVVWQTDLVVSAWKLAQSGAENARRHLADGLAILKRLDAQGKLTADRKGWIALFEAALQTGKRAP